jgi:hypothetical protein
MRKQVGFLEHIAQGAFISGQKQAVFAVLPALAVDFKLTLRRVLEASNTAQQRGFAGMAEQHGNAGRTVLNRRSV